ncbi:8-oxo-dGTP diphosphatase MutT [Marinomonas epiphytica]
MKQVHVAAGIIMRDDSVFIALRKADQHQGGLWEFPGGKCDKGESSEQALCRELHEECEIQVQSCQLFQTIAHDYGDKQVKLDFFLVKEFLGEPVGKEGQEVKWVMVNQLLDYRFPEANQPIVEALLSAH